MSKVNSSDNGSKISSITTVITEDTKPKTTKSSSTETQEIKDIVELNSTTAAEPVTYNIQQVIKPRPTVAPINLPDNSDIINEQEFYKLFIADGVIDTGEILSSIADVNNLDSAVEIVSYSLKYYKSDRNFLQNALAKLFINYDSGQIIKHPSLERLNIKKIGPNEMTYELNRKTISHCKYENKPDSSSDIKQKYKSRFDAQFITLTTSIKNNHKTSAQKILRETLKTANIMLNFLEDSTHYNDAAQKICSMALYLKPEYQDEVIIKLKDHWIKNEEMLSGASSMLFENKKYTEVIELLEPIISNLDAASNSENYAYCQYNLGMAYLSNNCADDALKCLQESYKIFQDDPDIIKGHLSVYTVLGEINSIKEFINQLPHSDLKKLLNLSTNLEKVTTSELNKIKDKNIPDIFKPLIVTLKFVGKFNQQKSQNKAMNQQSFSNEMQRLEEQGVEKETLFSLALIFGFQNVAKRIFAKIPEEIIKLNKSLQKVMVLLDSSNLALLSQIQSANVTASEKIALYSNAGSALLADDSPKTAILYVEDGLKIDPTNVELAEVGIASALLLKDVDTAKAFMHILSEEKQIEIAQNYSPDTNETDNINDLLKEYDPKKIHHYHSLRKKQELGKVATSIFSKETTWKIKDKEISATDTKYIGKHRNLDVWGYIAPKIQHKNKESMDLLDNALDKGIIEQKLGINGVKFLGNKAIELKIDGDLRLFTNNIYINKEGKLLVTFDHSGNHEAVQNFIHQHKLTYIVN